VSRFGARMPLPVRTPFRFDFTVAALRRLAANAVDVVDDDGATLYRALEDESGTAVLAIRQTGADSIEVRATGRGARRRLPVAAAMLGTDVDLHEWYARSATIEWLRPLAVRLRGLKPPRYPSLWEAGAHAIVFAQISILAAAAIMRRLVELLADPVSAGGRIVYPFPGPQRWLAADESALRGAGLSHNKVAHIRSAATAFADGTLRESALESLSTPVAAEALQSVRGIGPWSAAVMLLRGLGRLDVFPLRDSGVARSVALVAGRGVDLDGALTALGPTRGMLYFHLLLGRLVLPNATGARPARSKRA
jgi:DNA-3-methyladenine glycosylase II